MAQSNTRAQAKSIEDALERMFEWYVASNGGNGPNHMREYYHPVDRYTLRWLEPLLPYLENPVLIEQTLGDHWSLRTEPANQTVKVPT